jgi:hypothetical protein
MKLTKSKLKQIIKEEANSYLDEMMDNMDLEYEDDGVEDEEYLLSMLSREFGRIPAERRKSVYTRFLSAANKYADQINPAAYPAATAALEEQFINILMEHGKLDEGIKDIVPLARRAIKVGGLALVMSLLSGVSTGDITEPMAPGAGEQTTVSQQMPEDDPAMHPGSGAEYPQPSDSSFEPDSKYDIALRKAQEKQTDMLKQTQAKQDAMLKQAEEEGDRLVPPPKPKPKEKPWKREKYKDFKARAGKEFKQAQTSQDDMLKQARAKQAGAMKKFKQKR